MTAALARSFEVPQATGALVARVDADNPAHAAGLVQGDVISKFDGIPISHFTELLQHIAERRPGTRTRMVVWRHGKMLTVCATLSASKIASVTNDTAEWNDGLCLILGGAVARKAPPLAH